MAVSGEEAYLALSEVHKGMRRHKGLGLNRQMQPSLQAFLIIHLSQTEICAVCGCLSNARMPLFLREEIFIQSSIAALVQEVVSNPP